MSAVRVLNVDVLDDREPYLLVQRHFHTNYVYQVIRKPSYSDEVLAVSPGVEIDRSLFWGTSIVMEDEDVLAIIYYDDTHPPVRDPEQIPDTDPIAMIVLDDEDGLYHCEPTLVGYEALEEIIGSSVDDVVMRALDTLDGLIKPAGSAELA